MAEKPKNRPDQGVFSRESNEAAIIRAAKDGVEITPKMIEAGIKVFGAWNDGDNVFEGQMVCSVYRAMLGEMEITPKMLDAGVAALDGWFPDGMAIVDAEDLVREVLEQVFRVRPL